MEYCVLQCNTIQNNARQVQLSVVHTWKLSGISGAASQLAPMADWRRLLLLCRRPLSRKTLLPLCYCYSLFFTTVLTNLCNKDTSAALLHMAEWKSCKLGPTHSMWYKNCPHVIFLRVWIVLQKEIGDKQKCQEVIWDVRGCWPRSCKKKLTSWTWFKWIIV